MDIFLLDGLYADKKTINQILFHNSQVLIKTKETRLTIIQDADSLLSSEKINRISLPFGLSNEAYPNLFHHFLAFFLRLCLF